MLPDESALSIGIESANDATEEVRTKTRFKHSIINQALMSLTKNFKKYREKRYINKELCRIKQFLYNSPAIHIYIKERANSYQTYITFWSDTHQRMEHRKRPKGHPKYINLMRMSSREKRNTAPIGYMPWPMGTLSLFIKLKSPRANNELFCRKIPIH